MSDEKIEILSPAQKAVKGKACFTTDKSIVLKKHINLINCSQAQLNLRSQKIYNALLFSAIDQMKYNPATQQEDKSTADRAWFKVDTKELQFLTGVDRVKRQHIADEFKKLQSAAYIAVRVRDDLGENIKEWSGSNLVSEWRFLENERTNDIIKVEFKLPDLIRENIIYPKVYGQIDLTVLNKYRSRYAYSLDPFLRVNFLNYAFSREISLEDYRMVVGVPENAFVGRNDNLISKALRSPLAEIKSITPEMAAIDYELVKKGRSIIGIKFFKIKNREVQIKQSKIDGLNELIHKFNYKAEIIEKLRQEFTDEKIYAVLQYTYLEYQKRKDTSKEIKNLKAYAHRLLNSDFDEEITIIQQEDEVSKKLRDIERQSQKNDRDLLKELENEHNEVIREIVWNHFKSLSLTEREQLLSGVKESLPGDGLFTFEWDAEKGFANSFAENNFIAYVIDNILDKNDTSFENYVANRCGRQIKKATGGHYRFIKQQKTKVKTEKKRKGISLDDTQQFLVDYKLQFAQLLITSKVSRNTLMAELLGDEQRELKDTKVDKFLSDYICTVSLKSLSIEDICKINEATLLGADPSALTISYENKTYHDADALLLLHSFMPKSEMSVMPLIIKIFKDI